jgi:hypothetical protein
MAARLKITNTQLKAALKSSAGVPAAAAERLNTTRQNVCQRIASSPELQAWIRDIDATITDQAEIVVISVMQEKRADAPTKPTTEARRVAQWWLDRKGKDRGFSTRQEHTGEDGAPLTTAAPAVHIHVSYHDGQPEPEAEGEVL